MKAYIVTGATGFLGRAFVNWLIKENEKVIVIIRDRNRAAGLWGDRVEMVETDLTNAGSIKYRHLGVASDDEKIMIHFAWEGTSGDKRAMEMIQLNNVKASCALIRKAKELNCQRFLYAGSIMEYEAVKTVMSDRIKPPRNTLYSIAKLTADFMLKTIAADIGMDYLNIIISNIYGPGEESGRFLNRVIRSLIKNESIEMTEGYQLYDFIYSDDAMRMIKTVADGGNPFESYYIGNSAQRPLREFVIEAKRIVDSSSELLFGTIPFTGQALDYTEFDCRKMEGLGVIPEISFSEGIRRTAEWILSEMKK